MRFSFDLIIETAEGDSKMKRHIIILFLVLISASHAYAEGKHRFADAMIKLDLSDQQKTEIANILKSSRSEVKPKVDQMFKAKKNLSETIRQENFDEAAVRSAHKDLAKVQEDLAVLRAITSNKVMKVLKPEQKQTLNTMREKFRGKAKHKIAGFRKFFNHWIDKHAKG